MAVVALKLILSDNRMVSRFAFELNREISKEEL